jgi:hypothetical protein
LPNRFGGVSLTISTNPTGSYFIATGQFEGVKTDTNSWLLPVLEESYVADMIVDAIRTNQVPIGSVSWHAV